MTISSDTLHCSNITLTCELVTELDFITEFDIFYQTARGFYGTFTIDVANQQGSLTLPDTWFCPILDLHVFQLLRPETLSIIHYMYSLPFTTHNLFDLIWMLQLLRPNSSNLPCLYWTFHLEYPLVLSRFYLKLNIRGWIEYLQRAFAIRQDTHHPSDTWSCPIRGFHKKIMFSHWDQSLQTLSCFWTLSFEHPSVI